MPSRLDVLKLAGAGIALPLTGGAGRLVSQPSMPLGDIAPLMRRLGYNAIFDRPMNNGNRILYQADGLHKIVAPRGAISQVSGPCLDGICGGGNTFTDVGFVTGNSGGDFFIESSASTGTVVNQGWSNDISAPVFSFGVTPLGPEYWVGKAIHNCTGEIAGAATHAVAMARFIAANAPGFAGNVVVSARQALAKWAGTGLGIAAAAEFLGLVAASVTIGQWLTICAGIILAGALVYALYHCVSMGV